ncbi:hypothetical protein [Vagococcus xieshaowenii]|nr:hypothetical protein [Vagococcus xieshaowenii]
MFDYVDLYRAYQHCRKGKRQHPEVVAFEYDLSHQLSVLLSYLP